MPASQNQEQPRPESPMTMTTMTQDGMQTEQPVSRHLHSSSVADTLRAYMIFAINDVRKAVRVVDLPNRNNKLPCRPSKLAFVEASILHAIAAVVAGKCDSGLKGCITDSF